MTAAQASFRVASYNIRKGIGLDGRRRPERTLSVISRLGADILALQEADRRFGTRPAVLTPDLVSGHGAYTPVAAGGHPSSIGWHGNALLVRRGLPVVSARGLDLPGLEPRGALIVEIDLGRRLTVVATHLGLMRRHRRAQLAEIRKAVGDDNRQPVLILGDLNEWSGARGLEPLGAKFTVHSPGKTYPAALPVAGLDRIAIAGDASVTGAGVEQGRLARIASDHLPVWADITLGN